MEKQRHEGAFIAGALIGGAAGAIWGLLNAPAATGPDPAGFGRVFERIADRAIVAAADLEVLARTWVAGRDDGDAWRGGWDAGSQLWAEAPPQVDIVIDGPRAADPAPGA